MANISKIKLPSGVTYDVVDEKSGYITSASLPTKTSDLTNDSGYITNSSLNNYLEKSYTGSNQTGSISWNTYDNNNIYLFTQINNTNEDAHSHIGIDSYSIGLGTTNNSNEDSFTGEVTVSSQSVDIGFSNDAGVGDTSYYLTIDKYNGYHFRSINNYNYYHIYMPQNKSGTVALTSDIPTVPTITLNGASTTSPSFYAPTTAGTSGYVLTSSGSGAPSWASAELTDTKVSTASTSNSTAYYPVLGTDTTSATIKYYDKYFSFSKYDSSKGGVSSLTLGNNIASGTTGNRRGYIVLYGRGTAGVQIEAPETSFSRTVTFPDADGTIALTSDIPTVPTKTSQLTNDSGFITNSSLNNYLEKSYTNPDATYAGGGTVSWSHENDMSIFNIYSYGNFDLDEVGGSASIQVTGHPEGSSIILQTGGEENNSYLQLDGFQFYLGMNNTNYIYSTYNGIIVTNLVTPVNNTDAATKKYVDDSIGAITIPTKTSQLTNDSGFITGYTETDPTVPAWAKASTKPTYTASEVGAAPTSHSHGNITSGGDITATAPTIANGDQIIINDHSASKITNGPTFDGSTTTTALTPKGTWESFSKFSGSYSDLTNKPTIPTKTSQLTNDSGFITTDTNTTYTLSNALSSHKFTSTLTAGGSGSGTSTATITFAAGSNVTLTDDTTNKKITIAATDTKLQVAAITSGTTYYPIVGTGTTAATRQFDTTGFIYKGTNGTTSATGHSLLTLGNATATGTANNKQGRLELYGTGAYSIMITPGTPTAARTITLPNATGTLALTSDLNNYLPLTGGSVTGPVTFNDSITVDDATVGSLVVNGNASFTNNISANTINGVEVGSSPKFTDESIVDLIYPVGSIYMSVNNASPATFLKGTTWEQIKDRFLLAAGSTYAAGGTGGAATVTLTGAQSGVHQHTHAFTQPTVNGGSHSHYLNYHSKTLASGSAYDRPASIGSGTANGYTTSSTSHTHTVSGGAVGNTTVANATEAHNNMPPYLTVYMWKRTA